MSAPVRESQHSPLHTGLLASVSRSFYLSLRVLPKPVRMPLSLSYLLARAADTIADVPARPANERLALLEAFDRAIQSGPDAAFFTAAADFARDVNHDGERILLTRLPECWEALLSCTPDEAVFIRTVLQRIIHGQSLDLQRFADPDRPAALPDAAALDEYTWLVAGCVGEFWTEICALKIPRFSSTTSVEMIRSGTLYGKGLQLINILRDQPKDMAEGRCYLPEDELRTAGLTSLLWPASDWKPWHAVRRQYIRQAGFWLMFGRHYVRGLRSIRLRFAALLPLLIGEATLDLLDAQQDDQQPQAAKIPRSQVKRLMFRALWLSIRRKV